MKVHSRAELERDWSAEDVIGSHHMLDAMERAEARAAAEARMRAGEGRRRPR
jgi:hypothetical protein